MGECGLSSACEQGGTVSYNIRLTDSTTRYGYEVFHVRTGRVIWSLVSSDVASRYARILNQISGELDRPKLPVPRP